MHQPCPNANRSSARSDFFRCVVAALLLHPCISMAQPPSRPPRARLSSKPASDDDDDELSHLPIGLYRSGKPAADSDDDEWTLLSQGATTNHACMYRSAVHN